MEKWDLYLEDESKTGLTISKKYGEMPEGYFHIVVETLIKHEDGTYLVMQRALTKKESPGVFEGSAGGSIQAGESKEEGAIREVFEETGLVITEVIPTYYVIDKTKGVISQGYLALVDGEKDSIKYQSEETISHLWLTLPELKAFIKTEKYNQNHRRRLEPYLDTLN